MGADAAPTPAGGVRLTELLASISLATDLGTGQPLGHALRTCVVATRLAERLGRDATEVRTVHQATLLRFLGCTADASETAGIAGGDDLAFMAAMAPAVMGSRRELMGRLVRSVGTGRPAPQRARLLAGVLADPAGGHRSLATHCEVGSMLARRAGLGDEVIGALAHAYERWDGRGAPDGLAGDAIPFAVRVFVVARDADLARTLGHDPAEWVAPRRGRAYDPAVVDALVDLESGEAGEAGDGDEWDAALAAEPEPVVRIGPDGLDALLAAFADFADLKSPWIRGHSRRVATLAEGAAREAGWDEERGAAVRRAALLHDLGRVGVENGVWDKAGPLTRAERERVQLHSYLTDRIVERCEPLSRWREAASSAHERADASGYHRSLGADWLDQESAVLAAADVFAALVADRPHRPAHAPDVAARMLESGAAGALDGDAVGAVLAAAGSRPSARPAPRPAGLTDREVEVLALISRGATNKAVAGSLYISPKTVGRHIENLYRKIGVSSRAAAALFAMENDLLDGA